MKTKDLICKKLLVWAQSSPYDIVLPNYFLGRYELDVFKISESLMITEYEIKTSRSDFKRDFAKGVGLAMAGKHGDMKAGNCKPNRFFFVVPEGLVKPEEVPVHCGLIIFREKFKTFEIIRPAKILHRNKPDASDIQKRLIQTLCIRERVWREKYANLKARK